MKQVRLGSALLLIVGSACSTAGRRPPSFNHKDVVTAGKTASHSRWTSSRQAKTPMAGHHHSGRGGWSLESRRDRV